MEVEGCQRDMWWPTVTNKSKLGTHVHVVVCYTKQGGAGVSVWCQESNIRPNI